MYPIHVPRLAGVVTWVMVEKAPTKTNAEPTPHRHRAVMNIVGLESGSCAACNPRM